MTAAPQAVVMAVEPTQAINTISATFALTFLLFVPLRLRKLQNSGIKNGVNWQGFSKAAIGVLLSIILSFYWTRVLILDTQHKIDFLASLFASTLAALGLSLLLLVEQQRSYKPSDLATLYLLASVLCDAIYLTVPLETARQTITSDPVLFRCSIHLALLVLESRAKYPGISAVSKEQSFEESHSILSRVLLTWINPILLRGYRNVLVEEDLPSLNRDIKPELTRNAILQTWSQRAKPETKKTLPLALMKCVKSPFLTAIIPRLFLILFRYSQPLFIKESIRYVVVYPAVMESSHGYWLVVSAVVIYGGLAISTAVYRKCIHRLQLVTRSALVGLIHHKTMISPSISYDDGEATTLMSTDADSLIDIGSMVHETWAQVIEVVIGMSLLATQVGWVWPLPLFLIYLCSHMSRFVAKHLQPRQKAWNKATQSRIAATTSMLSAMKVVKMLGFQQNLTHRIQELRNKELWEASRLRWVMVYYNASANALGIFSPAITLAIFAVISAARGRNLDTETAFTTMAILSMVTHPANMIMTIVPRVVAAFAGFERIQSFLLRPSLQPNRGILPKPILDNLARDPGSNHFKKSSPAIQIRQLRIGHKQLVLENINIEVAVGSLAIISGPTGSGKSTLLRAILGEVVPAHGSISLSTQKIAYCAQNPWLPSGTIKQVIYGPAGVHGAISQDDEKWYHEVTDICCLTYDLDSLPDGDQTQIGSRGFNLSGGQRQRVALARALFARCDLLVLDDTFSGLDGETEKTIFDNIFGATGLIARLGTTVVLVSNSSQYFQAADNIVVLGDNGIIDQGNWQNIQIKAASIAKFSSSHYIKDNAILSANFDKLGAQFRAKDEAEVDLTRQTGDSALYGYYFGFVGLTNISILVATTFSYAFFITVPQYWLQLWTESDGKSTAFYTLGFLFLSSMSWISTSTQMWSVLIRTAPQSGSRIHQRLLQIVTSATLSYFSKTENGSILNRFSQDIQLVDKVLPSALQTIVTQIFKLLMQIVLLFIAQKWLAVSLPACMILVYMVQRVYLRTSRQLRFLELESRAGVFSSFLESVEGLETIRSFGWTKAIMQQNTQCVDDSQRPEFLLLCLQRWLNLVLNLLAAAIATGVVAMAVAFRGNISGAQVGIALNIMLVANTTLLNLVQSWTTLEISLGAIARLKTLEKTTPIEGRMTPNLDPPVSWPSRGHVEFKNIAASYQSESVALQNLSLNIPAGQKLIVCGRTGSGKSTLLATLLRLLELQSGSIEIDGIDIKEMSLDLLRQRCFIAVSQDPLILSNETLRFNLDPNASAADESIIDALSKTGLWSHFSAENMQSEGETATIINMPDFVEHPILDQKISYFQKLSVGQCQLFALSRALVKADSSRRSGVKAVVILDEVTSSLDSDTESTIYRIIDDEFTEQGHTVIIVAHRLNVLTGYTKTGRDAVALLADGALQEVIQDLEPATFQRLGQLE